MTNLVEITNLKFKYPSSTDLTLDIPNLQISKGEKVFLHGPSGTGKSTLLELLAGVLTPNEGQVKILNENLNELSSSSKDIFRSNHIGYIFQSFNLIPYLSVKENISLPLYFSKEKRQKVSFTNELQTIFDLTKTLGIDHLLDKKITELSVGQQQRVAAARALIGSPELILADEPTSALDYDHREKFIKLLFSISEKNNSTVIFVSHDKTLEKIFDRTISLSEVNKAGATV